MELVAILNFWIIYIRREYKMSNQLKILFVEDEVISAMFIELQLKNIGYKVSQHVTTGENAIKSIQSNLPDVILMDIRLAGNLDGIETAKVIKEEFTIPLIFITGYDDPEIRKKADQLNPIGYLIKPFEIHKLKTILEANFH